MQISQPTSKTFKEPSYNPPWRKIFKSSSSCLPKTRHCNNCLQPHLPETGKSTLSQHVFGRSDYLRLGPRSQLRQSISPDRKQSFTKSNRKSSSPSTNNSMMDFKSRKGSSESNMSFASRGAIPPPPPPPMPPPLDPSDEARGFLDPYGRAKTVRIGKWRWPPPKGTYYTITKLTNTDDVF